MNTLINRLKSPVAFAACLLASALNIQAQLSYSTSWVGNTYGDNAHHVGNCARAIWVSPEGVVYTASLWDENAGGLGIYQNGQNLRSMGNHGELPRCSITCTTTCLFAREQGTNYGK